MSVVQKYRIQWFVAMILVGLSSYLFFSSRLQQVFGWTDGRPAAFGEVQADSPSPVRENALEFGVKVEPDGATSVQLQQGRLLLKNPKGEAELHPGEEGYAEPHLPPEKKSSLAPHHPVPPRP